MLPSTITSYRAIPDAGFFMDVKDFSGNYTFGDKLRAAFKVANASGSLNEACKADHVDPYDCVFPQRFAQHIKTPLFPVQSLYDDYQVFRVLNLGCTPSDPTPPGACSPAQMEAFFQFGLALRAAANATGEPTVPSTIRPFAAIVAVGASTSFLPFGLGFRASVLWSSVFSYSLGGCLQV